MKAKTVFGFWGSLIFTILFLFNSEGVFSQQIIKLKNGKKYMATIKSQSDDTLVYQLLSKPKVTQWVLMNEVDDIKNFGPDNKDNMADTIPDIKREELYYQCRALRNIGLGFVIGGAVVTGLGMALLIPAAAEWNILYPSTDWAKDQMLSGIIITAIGAAGLLTGTILAITGAQKWQNIQRKNMEFLWISIAAQANRVFLWFTGFNSPYTLLIVLRIWVHLLKKRTSGFLFCRHHSHKPHMYIERAGY